ncbi:unnamed protein product [Sphagnum balticum]
MMDPTAWCYPPYPPTPPPPPPPYRLSRRLGSGSLQSSNSQGLQTATRAARIGGELLLLSFHLFQKEIGLSFDLQRVVLHLIASSSLLMSTQRCNLSTTPAPLWLWVLEPTLSCSSSWVIVLLPCQQVLRKSPPQSTTTLSRSYANLHQLHL